MAPKDLELEDKPQSPVSPDEILPNQSASNASNHDLSPSEKLSASTETYPHGTKLLLLLLSLYLTFFLVSLDRTIISTAVPRITDEFQSFSHVGWYNGAFMLPTTALQLLFGKIYTFYSPKWTFLTLVVIFEIGSAVCGAAPSSLAFIWGRAIAGLGASGLFNGVMILMMYAAPLEKRALYIGLNGAIFGIASIAGPLLGGVFTTNLSWRWCFYINLPIGAATIFILLVVVGDTKPAHGGLTRGEKISRLDIPGTLIFVPLVVCLLLSLQWGGQTYLWSDGRIIALLALSGVLSVIFVTIQIWRKDSATVPPRVFKQRTIAAGTLFSLCLSAACYIIVYFVPIWFQAIKGDDAFQSGLATIPLLLSMVVASTSAGAVVSRTGYYNPPMLLSCIIVPVGAGLFALFKVDTGHPWWIGVQVLFGFGVGLGLQQPNFAAQTVLEKKDVPIGLSVVFFGSGLGSTISVAIGQNLLNNELVAQLSGINGMAPQDIVNTGATELRTVFSAAELPVVLQAYNSGIVTIFYVAVAFSCVAVVGALPMEWRSMKAARRDNEA